MLDPAILHWLLAKTNWEHPRIDAFSNHHNHILPLYWTEEEDAFQQGWLREAPLWMNPPFHLFAAIHRKLCKTGGNIILLIPRWSTSYKPLLALSSDSITLPRTPIFLRQGWDKMPTPPWSTLVLRINHWPSHLNTLLGTRDKAPLQCPLSLQGQPCRCSRHPDAKQKQAHKKLLESGDIEPNPGPNSGPSSSSIPHHKLLEIEISTSNSADMWDLAWIDDALPGPAGNAEEDTYSRVLLATCALCGQCFHIRSFTAIKKHCCYLEDISPPPAPLHTPPEGNINTDTTLPPSHDNTTDTLGTHADSTSTGRGTLLTCGDVEENPGPGKDESNRQRRRPHTNGTNQTTTPENGNREHPLGQAVHIPSIWDSAWTNTPNTNTGGAPPSDNTVGEPRPREMSDALLLINHLCDSGMHLDDVAGLTDLLLPQGDVHPITSHITNTGSTSPDITASPNPSPPRFAEPQAPQPPTAPTTEPTGTLANPRQRPRAEASDAA